MHILKTERGRDTRVGGFCLRLPAQLFLIALVFLLLPVLVRAQQQQPQQRQQRWLVIPITDRMPPPSSPPPSSSPPAAAAAVQSPGAAEEDDFIKPSRPGVANPAEIQRAGVLQLEYGYEADFRAEEFHTQQSAPLTLRFTASSRLLLELRVDTVNSETDEETRTRRTGVGDTRLGFQVVALKDTERHPALAFAYLVKAPSASVAKGLGTGRFDHQFTALVSKKFGATDIDFNASYLVNGREDTGGWESGGQGALALSRDLKNGFGVLAELSGQSLDSDQTRGVFALGALTYQVNRRLTFDGGLRFGLNPEAPRIGVVAGFTVGVADFYHRK